MLPRTLEPESMAGDDEARDYDAMDHQAVNRAFVADLLAAWQTALWPPENGVNVLDVGTGTALIPLELCRQAETFRVTATDLSGPMLELAKRNVAAEQLEDRIRVVGQDCKNLAEEDESYDLVMSNSLWHHLPEPEPAWSEVWRVLRPKGLLFLRDLVRPRSVEELEYLVNLYAGMSTPLQKQLLRQSLHAAFTLAEVQAQMARLGIPAHAASLTSDRHWTVVAFKPDVTVTAPRF